MIIRITDKTLFTKMGKLEYMDVRIFTYKKPELKKHMNTHHRQLYNKYYYYDDKFDEMIEGLRKRYTYTEVICNTELYKDKWLSLMPV